MKMNRARMVGPEAASAKYDVLTALAMIGLHRRAGAQASVLRLIALVTARYNWRQDEFCVCQRDMARMWGVSERTVKREVRAWLDGRLVICKRPGVRGRAGAYRLDMVEIWTQADPLWPAIGPDFERRMGETAVAAAPAADVSKQPLPTGPWGAASRRLQKVDPAMHAAWFAGLSLVGDDGRLVTLTAPSRFAAHYIKTQLDRVLTEAIEAEMGPGRRVRVCAAEDV